MRKIVLLMIIITVAVASFAQSVPQTVNFTATIRDADSVLLVNSPVSIKVSFIVGGQYGTTVYCAEHNVVTDANGFVRSTAITCVYHCPRHSFSCSLPCSGGRTPHISLNFPIFAEICRSASAAGDYFNIGCHTPIAGIGIAYIG